MSRRSVTKGKEWEREVAARLEEATGLPYCRVLTEARDGNCGDVDAPGSPFSVQCKVGAAPRIYDALREAVEASEGERIPLAVVKKNGSGSRPPVEMAVLPLGAFLELVASHAGISVLAEPREPSHRNK